MNHRVSALCSWLTRDTREFAHPSYDFSSMNTNHETHLLFDCNLSRSVHLTILFGAGVGGMKIWEDPIAR